MKKLIAWMILICLALSLTGCHGAKEEKKELGKTREPWGAVEGDLTVDGMTLGQTTVAQAETLLGERITDSITTEKNEAENLFSHQHQIYVGDALEGGLCCYFATYDDDLPLAEWPLISVDITDCGIMWREYADAFAEHQWPRGINIGNTVDEAKAALGGSNSSGDTLYSFAENQEVAPLEAVRSCAASDYAQEPLTFFAEEDEEWYKDDGFQQAEAQHFLTFGCGFGEERPLVTFFLSTTDDVVTGMILSVESWEKYCKFGNFSQPF